MKAILFLMVFLLASCGPRPEESRNSILSPEHRQALQEKFDLYKNLSETEQDSEGFIMSETCDSLLFSGLIGSVDSVHLEAARDDLGQWHRRPLNYPECYDGSFGTSSISRDQLIGVMWYAWSNKRLDLAQALFTYGLTHSWIMGEGDVSATLFVPGIQGTLAELIFRLGGENKSVYRSIPQIYSENTNYRAHLDELILLLRAEMLGNVENQLYPSANPIDIIKYNWKRVPGNPLYSYIYHRYSDGNQEETFNDLMNEALFPKDRLPTSHDRCEPWINQRDGGKDWQPCDLNSPARTWSGGDFLFVARQLLQN